MEHTLVVSSIELERYANTRESESVIPELVLNLVQASVLDLTKCRIPHTTVNQPGLDGLIETPSGFRQYVPKGRSYWEIGTGKDPQDKATADFTKRTRETGIEERAGAAYVFVTPRSAGQHGWNEPAQREWISKRRNQGWADVCVLDGDQLANWLREFPSIGRWLLRQMGLSNSISAFSTPREHWENLKLLPKSTDPPLPPEVFLVGREQVAQELQKLFEHTSNTLAVGVEADLDLQDFVSAYLASLSSASGVQFGNRCILVRDVDAWHSFSNLRTPHVLVADQKLDLEGTGEQLQLAAQRSGHAVVIPVSGGFTSGSTTNRFLRSPSKSALEAAFTRGGYLTQRAQELSAAGALNLAQLKRYMRGLGDMPPYANREGARVIAQAQLIGRWDSASEADRQAIETILGKSFGEWTESVHRESMHLDTPLVQSDGKWKVMSRAEVWSALGRFVVSSDVDRLQEGAIKVLGEEDPKFDLPKEDRLSAGLGGKTLRHTALLRRGVAETLALIGSRSESLTNLQAGKAEGVATRVVRDLLQNASWKRWATLDSLMPVLAEAAPQAFLACVEKEASKGSASVFTQLFAQEGMDFGGWNYMSGILWGLETLAWSPDFLGNVTLVLGELAELDPGGSWSNRPAGALADIFLPWHPQTCASVAQRRVVVESLVREHPKIGWELLKALLPRGHSTTSGTRKPTWRRFISPQWSDRVTNAEYFEQIREYSDLTVRVAARDLPKLAELIDRLPDLPTSASAKVLAHLGSAAVTSLPESDRVDLWEALRDLATKHRKYSTANWAMSSDAVSQIEEAARLLEPSSAALRFKRLFSARDLDLYEEKGDFEVQRKILAEKRKAAVGEILSAGGIEALLDFAQQAESPSRVGTSLGEIATSTIDNRLLPSFLTGGSPALAAFAKSYLQSRFWVDGWKWFDSIVGDDWTAEQKTSALLELPFSPDAWERAERWLGSEESEYWKAVRVNVLTESWAETAIQILLKHGRPDGALACLYGLLYQEKPLPAKSALQVLRALATKTEVRGFDQHAFLEVLKRLQELPDIDEDKLCEIEWLFLPLLNPDLSEATPRTLERLLSRDAAFFCSTIRLIYRPEGEPAKDESSSTPTEQERRVAQNAYRLLHSWRTVPGVGEGGRMNEVAFEKWIDDVVENSKKSGHLVPAKIQIGHVLAYAPADKGGLWINQAVARVLDAKENEEIRTGFRTELFNMRGVHTYTAGEGERKLATEFRDKASALDDAGFHRASAAVRELAEGYDQDAEREAKRDFDRD